MWFHVSGAVVGTMLIYIRGINLIKGELPGTVCLDSVFVQAILRTVCLYMLYWG